MALATIVHAADNVRRITTSSQISNNIIAGMESQHRSIMEIPDEVILCIVEQMDTITRKSFMATNKGITALVEYYEHSIAKNRAASFILPPLGNILSSSTEERFVLHKNTFLMVHELELRQNRIDRLLKERPKVFDLVSPPWLPCLIPKFQIRLEPMLKRALYQCDRIADIAANEPSLPIPVEYYHAILDGAFELASALTDDDEDLYKLNPLTRPDARLRQIEYIRSLSLEDIAGLFILVEMIGYGRAFYVMALGSHGHFFWGGRDLQELAICIITAGKAELAQWESGDLEGPPGLKMTLTSRFVELINGGTGEKARAKMADTLLKLVLRGDRFRSGWEDDSDDEE
ncbi:hypothetical protein O1611_g4246 [Lasiodiplodia mahajangana]|uniref:Uncharacterized protein n=1 Tax=Lasiodiplodia mahajangana TaxID=1108764 RepID=A0ACC2JPK6_9PEZI|nr:hypothetical protein O1611_g4246 [Lasiodiplodia mahajangana]